MPLDKLVNWAMLNDSPPCLRIARPPVIASASIRPITREFQNGSPGLVREDQLLGLEDLSLRVTAAALHVDANPEKHPRLRLMLADLSEVMQSCEEELGLYQ